jgi:hypothetical protein
MMEIGSVGNDVLRLAALVFIETLRQAFDYHNLAAESYLRLASQCNRCAILILAIAWSGK